MTSPPIPPDDSQAGTVIAVVSSVLFMAFLAVSLRVYARAVLISKFGPDDYASVVSLVFTLICGLVVAWNTRNGLGTHILFLTPENLQVYMKSFYVSIVFYNTALGAIKATFLLQYYRVFPLPTIRNIIFIVGVVIGMWCVAQIFLSIFACTPVSAVWTHEGTCLPNILSWRINAAGNIITDLIILILPLPVIQCLNISMRQKILLFGIFCIGFFTCAISFVRISFLKLSQDFTWTNVAAACWSVGELCAGLTCACLPTIRPVFSRHFPGIIESSEGSSRKPPELAFIGSVTSGIGPGNIDGIGPGNIEYLPRPERAFLGTESHGELARHTSHPKTPPEP